MKYENLPLGPFSCTSRPDCVWIKTPTGFFDTFSDEVSALNWYFTKRDNVILGGASDYYPILLKVNASRKTATRRNG